MELTVTIPTEFSDSGLPTRELVELLDDVSRAFLSAYMKYEYAQLDADSRAADPMDRPDEDNYIDVGKDAGRTLVIALQELLGY